MPKRRRTLFVAIGFACIFVLHAVKAWNLPMWVIPDETKYSYASRLYELSIAVIPNYLYYAIYGTVDWFGGYFLNTARVYNAVFLMISGIFIYRIARMLCGANLSLLVTALSLLLPTTLNSAFFMPDIPLAAGFWAFFWLLLRYRDLAPAKLGLLAGATIAAMSFIKVHAVFWIPGLCLYLLVMGRRSETADGVKAAAKAIAAAALAFLAVKVAVGYAVAGPAGLTLLGSAYDSYGGRGYAAIEYGRFLWYTLYGLVGHLMILSAIFGQPILVAVRRAFGGGDGDGTDGLFRRTAVLFLSFFVPLLILASLFSALTPFANPGVRPPPYDMPQARFFNFLYPGLLIMAGWAWSMAGPERERRPRWLALVWIAVIGFAAWGIGTAYSYYAIRIAPHYPELGLVLAGPRAALYAMIALAAAPLALWLWNDRRAGAAFLFVFVPVYCLYTTVIGLLMIDKWRGVDDKYRNAALSVRDIVGEEKRYLTLYFDPGENDNDVGYWVLFYLDDKDIQVLAEDRGGALDRERILPDRKWVWVMGRFTYPRDYPYYSLELPPLTIDPTYRFVLLRVAPIDFSVDLEASSWPWPISLVQENEAGIAVRYRAPLPANLRVGLACGDIDPASPPIYVVAAPDGEGETTVAGSPDGGVLVPLNTNGAGGILWIRQVGGSGPVRPRLLRVEAAENERREAGGER